MKLIKSMLWALLTIVIMFVIGLLLHFLGEWLSGTGILLFCLVIVFIVLTLTIYSESH